jgi:hypothetical protein
MGDGSLSVHGSITHECELVNMKVGIHQEDIKFGLTKVRTSVEDGFDLVLGTDWMRKHNPDIDWVEMKIKHWRGDECPHHCFQIPTIVHHDWRQMESVLKEEDIEVYMAVVRVADDIHVENLYSMEEVPPEYRDRVIFDQRPTMELPPHRPYDVAIDIKTGESVPNGPIYALSELELKTLRDYLDDMLAKGFIRPSKSPAGAPILFVKKKDTTELRLCVDYRKLNSITTKYSYPLPLISELRDRLCKTKIYTKLDMPSAYNLLRVRAGDEMKTAFKTRYGIYEYLVMPFGLSGAPAHFQHFINDILKGYLDNFCVAYLDDVLIFSETLEEHKIHVVLVMERLEAAGLCVKPQKCQFHVERVTFLGHVFGPNGIEMENLKVKAIEDWKKPKTLKDLQSFLGFANYYRKFIQNYSSLAKPLTDLVKKDAKQLRWDGAADQAFMDIKQAFKSKPILQHWHRNKPGVVETDASDRALGGVLSQADENGRLHPVAYHSRKFRDAEINYEVHDKELLAIVDCLMEWRHMLEGAEFKITIYSDSKSLEYYSSARTLTRRQARWAQKLSSYDFVIKYRRRKDNPLADALSRQYSDSRKDENPIKNVLHPSQIESMAALSIVECKDDWLHRVKSEYHSDDELQHILIYLEDPTANRSENMEETLQGYSMHDGVLEYEGLIYVPSKDELKVEIVKELHDSLIAGHYGEAKTVELVSRNYFWPKMEGWIKKYVRTCDICHRSKVPRRRPLGTLQPIDVDYIPWSTISMDFIVKLPKSKAKDSIWVIVDKFTKMAHFIAILESITAKELALLFIREIVRIHGIPRSIISDRGAVFASKFWRQVWKILGTTTKLSTAYHPQTDGQTEIVNQTLERYLRTYCSYQQDDWVDLLPLAEFCYNNATHTSTKQTPFFANYGRHPLTNDFNITKTESINPASEGFAERLQKIHADMSAEIKTAQTLQKSQYDKKRIDYEFSVGDKVWLQTRNIATNRQSKKLDYKQIGPYEITEKIGSRAYRLKLPPSVKIHNVFHISLLSPYTASTIQGRETPPPPAIEVEGEKIQYWVNEILDSKKVGKSVRYLVSWEGYGAEENTWENFENLEPATRMLQEWHHEHPEKVRDARIPIASDFDNLYTDGED